MRRGTFTVHEADCLGTAYAAMNRSRVRHLPVTGGGRVVGMLSERDILAVRAHVTDTEWWTIPVRLAMTAPAQTAGPEDSVTEVAGRMALAKIGAMPVVERGKLLGIATVGDVLEAEVRMAVAPARSLGSAADAMTPYPVTVHPETQLRDAVRLMIDHHVRHLPVVDWSSAIVGMLSERDVRSAIGDPVEYAAAGDSTVELRIRDVMTKPVVSIPFDMTIGDIAAKLADDRVGALPVVDRFGALIGIVSYVDVCRVLAR
jgi:acetoin utilization protein AcuB